MELRSTLHGGKVTTEAVARVRDTVVFEGPEVKRKLVRFWILLILSTAIATYGLIGDSVATVIGAMIVAPLMLPIMGLAFGISIGDGRVIGRSLLVGIGGIVTAIAVGYLLALVPVTSTFDPERVGEVIGRTEPSLIDMLAALATGLAGAFAVGRKDVSDTLPGVAIAISLVPPLANVGILLAAGRGDLALGSLTLFLTNYFAIVLTGALVFGLMGYPQVAFSGKSRRGKRVAVALALLAFLVISVPLGAQSFLTWVEESVTGTATDAVKTWLEGSDYELVSITLSWSDYVDPAKAPLAVEVQGSGPMPPTPDLQEALAGELFGMDMVVTVVPTRQFSVETTD